MREHLGDRPVRAERTLLQLALGQRLELRAGVGIGTLYRRFPTRTQLVAAALVDKVAQYAEAAEQALSIPDPWAGFVTYVERICDLQADDRGLSDLLSMALPAEIGRAHV